MSKTILITGASSGIGKATALHFQQQGWNVVATMRQPDNDTELKALPRVLVARLDVLDEASITAAVSAGIERFGAIDVLLNNAGYGAYGPLEAFPMDKIRRQFDTNVIGLLAVTKAVLPHMRARGSGQILNVSSIGGKVTFPLGALYHGTKFAVEGLSEALHYELEPLGIRVKLIEPGMIRTDFAGRSFDFTNDESLGGVPTDGADTLLAGFAAASSGDNKQGGEPVRGGGGQCCAPSEDDGPTMRFPAAGGAEQYLAQRAAADDPTYFAGVKAQFGI